MLQQQILVRDEKLIFQLSTAAVEFRGSAQYTAHRIVLLPGAQVVLPGPHSADEQIFRRIERRDILDDRHLISLRFKLQRAHAVREHIVEPRLEYAEFGQRLQPGSVYWSSSSLWQHGTQAIYFARARIAVESARSVAISQACSEMTRGHVFGGW